MNRTDSTRVHIDGAACVRSRLLLASCDACQRICPVDAIDLGARQPVIDTLSCTGCGACVAVCMEDVFSLPAPLPKPQGDTMLVQCRCHSQAKNIPATNCIHSIGLNDLARMWLDGVRHLLVATAGCPTCEAAPMVWIETAVADFNQLAESRALPGIELAITSKRDISEWQHALDAPDPSRRAFLRRFVAPPADETSDPEDTPLHKFLIQGQTPDPAKTLYPFSPHIDATRCTGCDDCVNICPHDALTLIKAQNGKSLYHCAPERCTGCQLCSDICDVQAVGVQGMGHRGADILLTRFHCRACGVETHSTSAQAPENGQCRICQHTDHHKKLFVVLD